MITLSGSYDVSTCRPATKPEAPPKSFDAMITGATTTSIDLDLCSPAADCIPRPLTISAVAAGLDLSRTRVRSYVHIDLDLEDTPFYCARGLAITSIDAWGGSKNPVDVGGNLYFAGADGNLGERLPLPVAITREQTFCALGGPAGCTGEVNDDYALRFGSTRVTMGAYGYSTVGSQVLDFRNLRSFNHGSCDALPDWAWFIQGDDGLGGI